MTPTPSPPAQPPHDPWAICIARVSGIPIRVHFTFLLFVIWFAWTDFMNTPSLMIYSLLGLFFCVVLHELGHSVTAQRFGYPVRDITLYPIGGVASIEGSPRPRHELYIALAGPAVNVAIALVLFALLTFLRELPHWSWPPWTSVQNVVLLQRSPLAFLLIANVSIILFNLIPAFPMDGGRVLRAILGLKIGKAKATRIACGIGQILSVCMAVYGTGLLGGRLNYGLIIIAALVYFGAGQERQMEEPSVTLDDVPVRDAMMRKFQTLAVGDTLQRAADTLVATQQQDFPVLLGGDVAGVLSRAQLLRGLAEHGPGAFVAGEMTRAPLFARPDEPVEPYLLRPDGVQAAPVLVREPETDRLIGMLTLENLMEFVTVREITQEREKR